MSVYTPKKPIEEEDSKAALSRLNFDADESSETENEEEPILSPKELRKKRREEKRAANPGFYIFMDWAIIILAALAVALFINFFIIVNSTVPTGSMETTIMSGSRMIGFRVAYLFKEPQRGDIIVFRFPDDPSQFFVKRVIGLPGETVEVVGGITYIDGVQLDEPYINDDYWIEYELIKDDPAMVEAQGLRYNAGPYTVPEGSYFMMGDNRGNSRDSRMWDNKFVTKDKIIGKAWLCYFPFSDFGVLE